MQIASIILVIYLAWPSVALGQDPAAVAESSAEALVSALGAKEGAPRPHLRAGLFGEVEALEEEVRTLRAAFLRGNEEAISAAIAIAERVYEIRRVDQDGWTDADGSASEWWEVGDARRAVEDLKRLASIDQGAALLVEAETTKARISQLIHDGQFEEALPLAQALLGRCDDTLGRAHPYSIACLSAVSDIQIAISDLHSARVTCEEMVNRAREGLGGAHPETLNCVSALASVLWAQGDLEGAESRIREALQGRIRLLGIDDPSTLSSLTNLSILLQTQGRFNDAEPCLRHVLSVRQRLMGDDHPQTLALLSSMGDILAALGKSHEAEAYYRLAVGGYRERLGHRHPESLRAMTRMGEVVRMHGDLPLAETLLREASEGMTEVLGAHHPSTLDTAMRFGTLLHERGELAEALAWLEAALGGYTLTFGEGHPRTIHALNAIGSVHQSRRNFGDAEARFETALTRCRATLEPSDEALTATLRHLAALLLLTGEDERADSLVQDLLLRRHGDVTVRSPPSTLRGPVIELISPLRSTVNERAFTMTVFMFDIDGVASIEVLQNGRPLDPAIVQHNARFDSGRRSVRLTFDVLISSPDRVVEIEFVAANSRQMYSRRTIRIGYEPPSRELFILAIGVEDYEDDRLDLQYSIKDVDDLVTRMRAEEGTLFSRVHVTRLVDDDVRTGQVKRVREEFLRRAQPKDTILVFVAGHAMRTRSGEYFFLGPNSGPADPYDGVDRQLLESLVTWDKLYARRRLLLLDTCHAGAAFTGQESLRSGVTRPDLFDQREVDAAQGTGLYILAASTELGLAQEVDGNGLFTAAVLAGLDGAADRDDNGFVDVAELATFVQSQVHERSGGRQRPTVPRVEGGEGFPLTMVRGANK